MKRYSFITLGAILVMASFVFQSCEKDDGNFGLNQVIGTADQVAQWSDFPLAAFTSADDSILTGQPARLLLGDVNSALFGRTTASFSMQLLLEAVNPDFGANPVLDSAILRLDYTGFYGDTSGAFNVQVSALDVVLSRDSTYRSTTPMPTSTVLGTHSFVARPNGISVINGDTVPATLRIPLDPTTMQDLLLVQGPASGTYGNNNDFVTFFKGVRVETTSGSNGYLYFNPLSAYTRLELYYHNDADTTDFYLISNTSTANLNSYSHDFSGAEFDLNAQDTVNGELFTYAQSMGSVYTQLRLPELSQLRDSAFLINKAELVVPVELGSDGRTYPVPPAMLLTILNDDGTKSLIRDYASIEGGRIGGAVIRGEYRQKSYVFNITRHIFAAINDEEQNKPLALVTASTASTANRVKIMGPANPNGGIKLNIYYTKTK